MTIIKKYVERIEEELEDAKEYAEKYVEHKVNGETQTAMRYKEMSNDELKHAMYIHEWATQAIAKISETVTPPAEMLEKWEHEHKRYVDEVAHIKQMLAM